MSSSGLLLCPPWTATSPTNKTRSLMQIPNYHYGAVVASVAVPVLVVVQEGGVYPKPSLARITVVEYPQGLEANTMEVITLIRDQCKSTVEATAAHLTIFLGQDKFPVLQGQHKPTDRLMAHTAKVMLVLIPKGNLPLWFLPDILGVVLVVLASSLSSQCYDVLWADSALGNTTPSLIKEKSTSQDIITQESITRPEPKSEIQPAPSPSPILSLRGGGGGCLGFIEALFLGNGGYVDRDRQAFVRPSRHSHAGSSYRSSGSGHRRSHSHGGRSSRSHGGGSGGGHRSSRHGSNHHGRSHHRRSRRHGSPAHPPPLAQPPQAQSAPAGPVAVAETAAERLPRTAPPFSPDLANTPTVYPDAAAGASPNDTWTRTYVSGVEMCGGNPPTPVPAANPIPNPIPSRRTRAGAGIRFAPAPAPAAAPTQPDTAPTFPNQTFLDRGPGNQMRTYLHGVQEKSKSKRWPKWRRSKSNYRSLDN